MPCPVEVFKKKSGYLRADSGILYPVRKVTRPSDLTKTGLECFVADAFGGQVVRNPAKFRVMITMEANWLLRRAFGVV